MIGINSKLTPAEKQQKQIEKARQKAERKAENARLEVIRAKAREERFEAMPEFVVRESREVTVKAETMSDAIELASIAFEKGQEDDYSLNSFDKPWRTEGDTIDKIRTVNIKAVEND